VVNGGEGVGVLRTAQADAGLPVALHRHLLDQIPDLRRIHRLTSGMEQAEDGHLQLTVPV